MPRLQSSPRPEQMSSSSTAQAQSPTPLQQNTPIESNVHYTAFIRLPFPRKDFIDPPLVKTSAVTCNQIITNIPRPIGTLPKTGLYGRYYRVIPEVQTQTVIELVSTLENPSANTAQGKNCTYYYHATLTIINALKYHSASRFDVTLPFILQQAAWLYERQLSQVRAQMRKVGKANTSSPSPGSGSATAASGQQPRTGTLDGGR